MPSQKSFLLFAAGILIALLPPSAGAWSNRGHRMINQVAAETLPGDVPPFMRSEEGVRAISYLGPEPDRWRPEMEPELCAISSPDHIFRTQLAATLGPLPRRRLDFERMLETLSKERPAEAAQLTPEHIGTLPWQAEEVFERLVAAFHSWRVANGQYPAQSYRDLAPLDKSDLPEIQASALFYAGWLGHYIGDGSMPLHASVDVLGWAEKSNPRGYTTSPSIHPRFEGIADQELQSGAISDTAIRALVPQAKQLDDPFAQTLLYLKRESTFAEQVYAFDKEGQLTTGSGQTQKFIELRMAEGASMLRDLIYTAWVDSAALQAPHRAASSNALNQ